MDAFFDFFATVMAFFYSLVPSYAFAIVMLTLTVMLVVTPLTLKGTRSMMVMQQLQPEIKKIQQKYKDDRQTLNEELLKFYKENSINPMGGCLPLLVQMPVFIVLYQVLRGLTRRVSDVGFDLGWVQGQLGQGVTPTKAPSIEPLFDPAYLNHNSKMYQSLSETNTMSAGVFGMDLSQSASQALSEGVVHALPYLVLIVIVGATGFIQQRQIQGRNTNSQVNPQQQMIMKLMPIFLPVISFTLPSGLVLYFAVSNTYRIAQQAFISRSIYGMSRSEQRENRQKIKEAAASGKTAAPAKGGGQKAIGSPKKSFGDRMKEMAGIPDTSTPPAKSGKSTSAKKPAAKSGNPAKAAAAKPNGRAAKPDDKAPAKSTSNRTAKSGSGSAKNARPAETTPTQPALQPRARKNKKR